MFYYSICWRIVNAFLRRESSRRGGACRGAGEPCSPLQSAGVAEARGSRRYGAAGGGRLIAAPTIATEASTRAPPGRVSASGGVPGGFSPPGLGLKGRSPWSRTPAQLQRGSPSASRARAGGPPPTAHAQLRPSPTRAYRQRNPKQKSRDGFRKGRRPFARCRSRAPARIQGQRPWQGAGTESLPAGGLLAYSRTVPSGAMVMTFTGRFLPLMRAASWTARVSPPQQGTVMRVTVMELISLAARMSASLAA